MEKIINIDLLRPKKLSMFERTPESFSKFKVVKTGEEFYYCNYDNGLYDLNFNLMSQPSEKDDKYINVISETRSRTKLNNPYWLRILFGHACNYSCSYCMQKDIGNPDERAKIDTIDDLIAKIGNLDLSRLGSIDLWGGETLLYWNSIMPIMEKFDREGLQWLVPTNGTPLQLKHIDFFSKLKGTVGIGISHDGPAHETLRGKEFLHKKVDVIKAIQSTSNVKFSFNVTLSRTNFDLFEINDFFYSFCVDNDIDPSSIFICWLVVKSYNDEAENSSLHTIGHKEIAKFDNILHDYLEKCAEQKYNGANHMLLNNSMFDGKLGVIDYIKTLKTQIFPTITTFCAADDAATLSIDVNGNVRTCPHVDDSFISGNMDDIGAVQLKKLVLDRYETNCKSCPVFRLCKSGCPLETSEESFNTNCSIDKAYYSSIQLAAFRLLFNSDVYQC